MVEAFGMPHFFSTLIMNKTSNTMSHWKEIDDRKEIV
jgi:hypothetical protein